jgi:hypothetical protein
MIRILTMAVGTCALLGACATIANPSHISRSDPLTGATGQTTSRLPLKNWSPDVRIYANGALLPIYDDDSTLSARLSADCFELQRMMAQLGQTSQTSRCNFAFPVLVLPKRAHTLRLVRGTQEATVTVKPSFHWAWFFANGVWMTFAPVGWVVDLAGGRWSYFSVGGLDVAAAFRDAARQASGGRQ